MDWRSLWHRRRRTVAERKLGVRFDLDGWRLEVDHDFYASWSNDRGDHLLLTKYDPGIPFRPARPDAPIEPDTGLELEEGRHGLERALKSAGGTLLLYELVEAAGRPAVLAIMQYRRIPPAQTDTWTYVEPWYVGRLRVRREDGRWMFLEVQCEDRNPHMTGVRGVAAYLAGSSLSGGYDDERLDADYPDDPLSRIRTHLRRFRDTLDLLA